MNRMITNMKSALYDFSTLIYPELCYCCEAALMKQEKLICMNCLINIPRTYYHLVNENPVEKIFWGRVKIEKATSYFLYQKGSNYQQLLHSLKYKGVREIGVELGRNFGNELSNTSFFDDIDVIVPVPLHPKKERNRGYNQSLAIAEGLSIAIDKPIDSKVLIRKHFSQSQTRKGRFARWENVSDLFDVKDQVTFAGKHILLVDDVVTTGSTLEACAQAILKCPSVKVSIATLAFSTV
jgi:ComF family protein